MPTYDDINDAVYKNALISLHAQNVAHVVISFDGSGDEGHIQGIAFYGRLGEEIAVTPPIGFEEYIYEQLISDYDWVNNDGGYGVCHILVCEPSEVAVWNGDSEHYLSDLKPGHGATDYNIRYTETNSYTGQF